MNERRAWHICIILYAFFSSKTREKSSVLVVRSFLLKEKKRYNILFFIFIIILFMWFHCSAKVGLFNVHNVMITLLRLRVSFCFPLAVSRCSIGWLYRHNIIIAIIMLIYISISCAFSYVSLSFLAYNHNRILFLHCLHNFFSTSFYFCIIAKRIEVMLMRIQ